MRQLIVPVSIFILLNIAQTVVASETTQFIRIPSTLFGPSGLLLTQSIDTREAKKLEIGIGFSSEESKQPDFTETMTTATATLGLSSTIEASVQVPYFTEVQYPGTESSSELGDLNLSLKWRFMDASPDLNFPGFALSFTVFFPTGDPKTGSGTVESWGVKALIVSSAEAEIVLPFKKTLLLGFYADGGIYIQDSGDPTEEKHGVIDLGFLIPLTSSKNIQLLLEGNGRLSREKPMPIGEAEYLAGTLGLRYVTHHIALTGGWQRRLNEKESEDTDLFLFQGSYTF